jgi:hypothetical protein
MPAPTSPDLRRRLLEMLQAGLSPPQIAEQLSLPGRTVRCLVARARQPEASDGLQPSPNHGRPLHPDRSPLRLCCLQLRRDNPGWGAGRIRLEMQSLHKDRPAPPRALSSAGCARPV